MATTKPSSKSGTVSRGWRQQREYITYLALAAIAVYYMRIVPDSFNVSDQMMKIIDSGRFTQTGMHLRKEYTGIPSLDYGLSFLVVAFTPAAASFDEGAYWQALHFLFSFFPVVSIWAIESCRKGNDWAMVSFTAVWPLFYQTVGGAIIIPLYYLAYTYTSSRPNYFSPASQAISVNQARTLLPALALGFLLPTFLVFYPWQNSDTQQLFVALWQPCPLFVNALHFLFAKLDAFIDPESTKRTVGDSVTNSKWLRSIYLTAFTVSIVVHVVTLGECLFSTRPSLSLYHIFVPRQARGHLGLTEALHFIFQIDWWVIFGASMIWCVQAIWDLNAMGKIKLGVVEGAVYVALGAMIFGPGATLSLVWWFRERTLTGPWKSKAS